VDPGPISIILLSPVYFTRTVYFTRILLSLSTRYAHTLCFKQTGEIDNLIASWEQSTWLCCVQVPRCYWPKTSQQVSLNGALVGVLLSQSASPSVVLSALLLIDIPWFLNWGKTCCYIHQNLLLGFTNKLAIIYSSYLPLGVPNWTVNINRTASITHEILFCNGRRRISKTITKRL
jgi:hypothetical protein